MKYLSHLIEEIIFQGTLLLSLLLLLHCNDAKPVNIDASGSATGFLLSIELPGTGGEPLPDGFPSPSVNTFYDAGNSYVDLNFPGAFSSDETFTMSFENVTTVQTPAFVGYDNFTLLQGETVKNVGFALGSDDDNCLDRSGDRFSVRIRRNSTGENFAYTFVVLDGDYCVFESAPTLAPNLGGLAQMDATCAQLAIQKGLPRVPTNYKAMVAAVSASHGNRNPGEALSPTSFFRSGKKYVRRQADGIWVKIFQNSSSWPPNTWSPGVNFDNPFGENANGYWTGMNSGWGSQTFESCMNPEGSESWKPSTTSTDSGAIGAPSISPNDAARANIQTCSSATESPSTFICVYSP